MKQIQVLKESQGEILWERMASNYSVFFLSFSLRDPQPLPPCVWIAIIASLWISPNYHSLKFLKHHCTPFIFFKFTLLIVTKPELLCLHFLVHCGLEPYYFFHQCDVGGS